MAVSEWYQKIEGRAEHLVYLDSKGKELDKLINNEKTMIIRGAAGKKCPLGGRVKKGDILYFVQTNGNLTVTHRATVKDVLETDKMEEDKSKAFIDQYAKQLNLAKHQYERWAGKKYLCLIEVEQLESIESFIYRRDNNMDDWIVTDDINKVKA